MAKVSVKLVNDDITPSLNRIQNEIRQVPLKAANFYRSITPKRTGNARSKTDLMGTTIRANYEYATQLDKGSSNQAPDGMTNPTIFYINKLVKGIMRG